MSITQTAQLRPPLTPEQRRILAQIIDVLLADRAERKGSPVSNPKNKC